MESRKMILKNLLTGQQWRNIENGLVDMGSGEERARGMERVTQKLTLPHVKIDIAVGICCMAQETQRSSVST